MVFDFYGLERNWVKGKPRKENAKNFFFSTAEKFKNVIEFNSLIFGKREMSRKETRNAEKFELSDDERQF